MKIEIDHNEDRTICRIELMDVPEKMVNISDADEKSQSYALKAFGIIDGYIRHKRWVAQFEGHPIMHIRKEIQVTRKNIEQLMELSREGVILTWSCDTHSFPDISLLMDNKTVLSTNDWLLQDTEGRWRGMDESCYRMLKKYNKIIIE